MATYTGTGTQDDPYIVADWDSFAALFRTQNIYIKWAETDNKVIDFNDIKPDGYTGEFAFFASVDFNGWTFRNLRFIGSTNSTFAIQLSCKWFKNASFENIMYSSRSLFWISKTANNVVRNISCTGIMRNEEILYNNENSDVPTCLGCSFVFDVLGHIDIFKCSNRVRTQDCYFKINYSGTGTGYCSYNASSSNCLFKIKAPNAQKIQLISGNYYSDSSSTCVYNIETPSLTSANEYKFYTSIFNSSKVHTYPTINGLYPCTDEQMKDVEYLQSIGFPIGAV